MSLLGRLLAATALVLLTTGGSCDETAEPGDCVTADACCTLAGDAPDACTHEEPESGWGASEALEDAGLEQTDGVLRLKPNTVTRVPVVWVTSTNEQKVAQYDSATGREVLRVPTWGSFPNRTAVAADGSVWITNRDSGSYVHIGRDGTLLCSSPVNGSPEANPGEYRFTRAAAVDARGMVWIGDYGLRQLWEVDPTATSGTVTLTDPDTGEPTTMPRCLELKTVQLETTAPYGLAADGEGNLWVGTLGYGTVARVDTVSGTVVGEYDPADDPEFVASGAYWSMYGMTLDTDGNPWFANTSSGNMVRLDRQTGLVNGVFAAPQDQVISYARAGGLDRQGHIWVADNSTQYVHEFLPDGTWVKRVDLTMSCGDPSWATSPGTLGTGSDIDGNMWTVLQNAGKVVKYRTDGTIVGCYPDGNDGDGNPIPDLAGPYTYSDLTGSTLDLVTSSLGRWRGAITGVATLHWLALTYELEVPAGTKVCSRVRTADTADGLELASWSDLHCDGGVFRFNELGGPTLPDSKALGIELQLSSTDASVSPSVWNLSVAARVP